MDLGGNPIGGALPPLDELATDDAIAQAEAAIARAQAQAASQAEGGPATNGLILDLAGCGLTGTLPAAWARVPRVRQLAGLILNE